MPEGPLGNTGLARPNAGRLPEQHDRAQQLVGFLLGRGHQQAELVPVVGGRAAWSRASRHGPSPRRSANARRGDAVLYRAGVRLSTPGSAITLPHPIPAIDGEVWFFDGIRSERQLIETASLNLAHRWYLGYALDEPLPDHSSLTRIRQRLGIEIFERFFEKVVDLCQQVGLVWGRELYFDATKVAANAALTSLQPRFAVEAHLAHLFGLEDGKGHGEGGGEPEGEGGDAPAWLPVELTDEARAELAQRATVRQDWIGRAGRPHRAETSGTYRRTADFRVSTNDPEATPVPVGDGHTHLGYQDHYVVDGGRARVILAALVAPAEVQENQPALDLQWWARFRWKLWPRQITGDTK